MNDRDVAFRNLVYARFVELGRAPLLDELDAPPNDAEAALRRLHDAHALVLDEQGTRIRMLLPFSAVPTPHVVDAGGRTWFANCAWDAFGIPAALGVDGRISSTCPDCEEPIEIEIRGEHPAPTGDVTQFVVPAAHWWDDIVFT